jgi:hypothetical protein
VEEGRRKKEEGRRREEGRRKKKGEGRREKGEREVANKPLVTDGTRPMVPL